MYAAFRNIIDRLVALCALALVTPVLGVAIVLIRRDGGPAFFTQERVGKDAEIFRVFKLRTMVVDADKLLDARGLPTGNRVTRVGQFLRETSIDELPQFWNIIKGDMALIGPRPILPRMVPYMTDAERRRFLIRPGVTGLAQIKGRNFLRWSRRFRFDQIYVARRSLSLDLLISVRTIVLVLKRADISLDVNRAEVDDITIRTIRSVDSCAE